MFAIRMFTLSFIFGCVLLASQRISAEVGQDCTDDNSACDPGEVCVADGLGEGRRICSRSCSSVNPCIDPFMCTPFNGLSLCLPMPKLSEIGASCEDNPCELGLHCVQGDDSERICAQFCESAGTCPRGYTCRRGQNESGYCLADGGVISIGEPCDQLACAEGLDCIAPQQERSLAYCSRTCSEQSPCSPYMQCDSNSGYCRHPVPETRSIGADCLLSYVDATAAGCGEGLICEPSAPYPLVRVMYRGQGWCTQECHMMQACPEGYGCDYTQGRDPPLPGLGVCQEGFIDAPGLGASPEPSENLDSPIPPVVGGDEGSLIFDPNESMNAETSCMTNQEKTPLWIILWVVMMLLNSKTMERLRSFPWFSK